MLTCNYCGKMIAESRICEPCGEQFCHDTNCFYLHGCENKFDKILTMIANLDQENRETLFREKITEKFCFYCGSDDPDCKCYKL